MTVRDERGFTLVELVMACALLAVGIGGALSVFGGTLRGEVTAERHQVAVKAAEEAIEEIRGLDYDRIKLTAPPPAGADAGVVERVAGAGLRLDAHRQEELVLPTDPSPGTPAVRPYDETTVGSGDGAIRMRIYRFVSWRDEECPLLDLRGLQGELADVDRLLRSVRGLAVGLVGSNGSIPGLARSVDQVGGLPVLGLVLRPLLAVVEPLGAPLGTVERRLAPLLAPLQRLAAPVEGLAGLGSLSQRVDLCDVDLELIRRLGRLRALRQALAALEPVLRAIATPVGVAGEALDGLLRLNALALVGAIGNVAATLPPTVAAIAQAAGALTDVLDALARDVGDLPGFLDGSATSLASALSSLVATPDHARNTKRVQVAVVVEPRNGLRPAEPVWSSTVITDPRAGLLG